MLNNLINPENKQFNFYINDVGLFVDPTSISIHKEGMTYSSKTLRTNSSVKFSSGNGIYHVQLSLVFPPDSLIQLHRIICQIKNNPFVYIENDFIKDSIDPISNRENQNKSAFFTCMGINVINHPSSPGSLLAEMDLRLFNEKAYSPQLNFKLDETQKIINSENQLEEISFNLFEDKNIISTEEKKSEESIRAVKKVFNDSKIEIAVSTPYRSKIYKRYSNWLQNYYLQVNFEIDVKEILNKSPQIKSSIEKGEVGFHEYVFDKDGKKIFMNKVRDEIIHKMLRTNLKTTIYSRNFIEFNLEYKTLKSIQNFINGKDGSVETRKIQSKKLLEYMNGEISLEEPTVTINDEDSFIENKNNSLEINNLVHQKESNREYVSIYPYLNGYNIKYIKIENNKYSVEYDPGVSKIIKVLSPGKGKVAYKEDNEVEITLNELGTIKYKDVDVPEKLKDFYQETKNEVFAGSVIGLSTGITKIEVKGRIAEKIKENKETSDFLIKVKNNTSLEKLKNYVNFINDNFNLYTRRKGLENIFESYTLIELGTEFNKEDLSLLTGLSFEEDNNYQNDILNQKTIITSITGSFRHIVPSIPILGLEYPTHQFLGSIEPVYQMNLLEQDRSLNDESSIIRRLEEIRKNGQFYIKNFPEIPDSNQISIDNFITRLFGSYNAGEQFQEKLKSEFENPNETEFIVNNYNISLDSLDTFTVEGSPGAVGFNMRFSESKSYNDEKIKSAVSNELSEKSKKEIQLFFHDKIPKFKENFLNPTTENLKKQTLDGEEKYEYGKWKTKFFLAEHFYKFPRNRNARALNDYLSKYNSNILIDNNNLNENVSPDRYMFRLAQVLSEIQLVLNEYRSPNNPGKKGYSINLFSTLRGFYNTNSSVSNSNHNIGAAADTVVGGLNVMEFAVIVKYLVDQNKITSHQSNDGNSYTLGIGMYGLAANDIGVKMSDKYAGIKGFVHIDLNAKITNSNGKFYGKGSFKSTWNRLWFGKNGKDKFDYNDSITSWWNDEGVSILNSIKNNLDQAIENAGK